MGGSTTQSSSYMPSGQSGGFPAGPSFGMGQWGGDGMGQFGGYGGGFGGYGGGLGGYGGGFGGYGGGGFGGYGGGFPQTGNGKGFQPMPPQRPQAQYAPMQFLPPQFAQPRFMYPSVAGQMAGQRPVALPQQRYQQPSPAYPFPPVSGGGKGFQGGPRQPMPPGPRPLPIAPRNPGGGPQPFMPGGQQDQFALPGPGQLSGPADPWRRHGTGYAGGVDLAGREPARDFGEPISAQPAVMPREETEPRDTTMPVTDMMYRGNKFGQMATQSLADYTPFPPPVDSRPPLTEEDRMSGRYQLGSQGPIDMDSLPAEERAAMEKRWQEMNARGPQEVTGVAAPVDASSGLMSSLFRGVGNAALPVGTAEPARIQPREPIQPVFDETKLQ